MMGIKQRDFGPIVGVSLDDLVPHDNFYRYLEAKLDLCFVRDLVSEYYTQIGRPSIDPVVFFKLQLVMFFEGIRSERELLRVAADRLSLRWYLGYDLTEPLPDHSSMTKIRERYGLELFRRFFDSVVELCKEAGLVWGEELMIDATKVEANAARSSLAPRFAVEAHLQALFGSQPSGSGPGIAPVAANDPTALSDSAETSKGVAMSSSERHNWIEEAGRQRREVRHLGYRRNADMVMSTTDPDATDLYKHSGGPHLGYLTHYVIDGGKSRVILRALVTPAEVHEPQPACDLLLQTCFRWKLRPSRVVGDSAYGTIEVITALERAGIRAYVPLSQEYSRARPGFTRDDFAYDAGRDCFICPEGQVLTRRNRVDAQGFVLYRAGSQVCNACPARDRCTPCERRGRAVQRHVDEAYRDRVRTYHKTEAYLKAMRKRAVWIEPLFGEAKSWHWFRRFRLRGIKRVNIEAQLVATGQNLKRLLSRLGWGHRHWPGGAAGIAVASVYWQPVTC